ncbi:hypothetical protein GGF32_003966 [Allomyces javanicus]|nr:hypothetical protein GGF32_003966 [Allomyces javanicus]
MTAGTTAAMHGASATATASATAAIVSAPCTAPTSSVPDLAVAAVAQTPQWAAVVRGWEEAAVANAPAASPPSPADVWVDLEHTTVMRDLRAVARARIDAAVYRHLVVAAPASVPVGSHAMAANDQLHAAAARLLDQLPPALRHLVALPRLVHLPATTAHGMRMRWTVWKRILPHQHAVGNGGQVGADLIGKAKAWDQRVSAAMAETFLAVRDTYPTVIPAALLGLATRVYAWCHVLSGQPSPLATKHRGLCDVWTVHFLTSRPTALLAKVAIAFMTVYLMGRGFDALDAEPDDMHGACVDVATLVLTFLSRLQVGKARRAQLMDLALRGSDVAPADAVQFEQLFRALFVGVLPWGTLILVLDHLVARPDAFEAAEDVLVALVRASQGDHGKLARIDRSGLLTRLHPPANTARRAAPAWLAPPSLAAEQARIEAMADTIAATPMRARVLVQRWQRVARACGTWAMYLSAIRARVRARRALPAPTAAPAPPAPPPEETTPRETSTPAVPTPPAPIANPLARLVDLVVSHTVLAGVTDVPAGTVDWAMQRGVEYEEKIRAVEVAAARARVAATGVGKTRGK